MKKLFIIFVLALGFCASDALAQRGGSGSNPCELKTDSNGEYCKNNTCAGHCKHTAGKKGKPGSCSCDSNGCKYELKEVPAPKPSPGASPEPSPAPTPQYVASCSGKCKSFGAGVRRGARDWIGTAIPVVGTAVANQVEIETHCVVIDDDPKYGPNGDTGCICESGPAPK